VTFRVECPDGVGPTRGAEPIGDGGLGTTTVRWALCASSAALIIAILTLASILIASGAAEAHPTLLFTDPAGDSAVAQSPPMLDLEFNEPVTIGARAVALFDASGRELPIAAVNTEHDGRIVTARPGQSLAPGSYRVRWRATGADGDLVESEFRFAVGVSATALPATTTTNDGPRWSTAGWRALLFAGFALAFGGVITRRSTATARAARSDLPELRSWVPAGLGLALAGAIGLAVTLVADAGALTALDSGTAGLVLVTEIAGLAAALAVSMSRYWRWTVLPLLAVAVAEGIRSHAAAAAGGWGAVLTTVHLLAAAAWAGGLVHTLQALRAWRHVRAARWWVLRGYVRVAAGSVLLLAGTGVVSGLWLVSLSQLAGTGYGRILLIKLAMVLVATVVAAVARRLRQRRAASRLIAAAGVEAGLLLVVLVVAAVLVSTPPGSTSTPTAGAPPLTGPVLPLGTLAGQIGVSVTADAHHIVIRLATPRRGDYYTPEQAQRYSLTAAIDTPRHAIPLHRCGNGCYTAAALWRQPITVLTLRAAAAGWRGGTVSLPITWPVPPASRQLAAAVAATRAAGPLTVYESVTSDTTTGTGTPARLTLDPAFFIAQEPYADGTAPQVVRVSTDPAPVRLALGYPAAATTVLLTLDGQGRISSETLTDTTHLISRHFVYDAYER